MTLAFTGFHIKASPSQLAKHLWNVCCFFVLVFESMSIESGSFGSCLEAPPPPSPPTPPSHGMGVYAACYICELPWA